MKDHTKSDSTRKPGYYDKHLDKCLRPKKMVYCPDLTSKLGDIADNCYKKYKNRFGTPPACDEADFNLIQDALWNVAPRIVRGEEGILKDYAKKVPEHTLPIVSALAFEAPSWKRRYLEWTNELTKDKAIVDAALQINLSVPPHDCPCAPRPKEKKRRKYSRVPPAIRNIRRTLNCQICDDPFAKELQDVARYFPCVTLYEFKSVKSGTIERMIALLEMTCNDGVDWEECDDHCNHDMVDIPISGSRTGFDAETPILQFANGNWTEVMFVVFLDTRRLCDAIKSKHRTSARHMAQQVK